MQPAEYARRRPVRRACRLVRSAPVWRRTPLHIETASTYNVALARVCDMRRLFPDFYQEHVAHLRLTPRALLAVVQAFLGKVSNELFELEDCMAFDIPQNPLHALIFVEDGSRDPLLTLEEGAAWLCQPQPVFYGVGTENILDDETPQQLLTLALWHLCRATNWGIGVDVGDVIGFSAVDPDIAAWLLTLPPLPPGTAMERVATAITLPPWSDENEFDELLAYPFARTDNAMANVTNHEIEMVYGGEHDFEWDDAREIADMAAEAQALEARYDRWARAVEAEPQRALRKLATALHAAADAPFPAKTLIEILTEREEVLA